MSSVAQMLRQAEALKASVSDSSKTISETWVSRQKLEDIYKKVLLVDLEYALDKKVEQELWNHAFKNQITNLQTQAKDKQNIKRAEIQASLNLFLETASGFYLQFLQLLCTTFKLDLPFRRKSAHYGIMREKTPLKLKVTPPKKSSCLYVCQHCLVHLGDIARYRQQIDQAQTYYWHAASLVPFNGQPYNQLAILEAAKGNKLSTVFYYIRSLAVKVPFPAAATNLEKLYAKLTKDTPEFKGKLSASEMIVGFLQFHALVHLCTDLTKAQELSMKLATGLPAHVTSQSFPWQVLVQIVAVNIFAMTHIQPSDVDVDGQTNGVSGLTGDEEKCFDLVFTLTVLMLDILLQYTPKQENKVREYFTLPAVKLLLDWFRLNPHIYDRHVLKYSPLWTNLSKVLNSLQPLQPDDECIAKYEDLPLPEDAELRCFQPIEKAQSGYSYSRVPADGIPSHMEAHLRCRRLLDLGRRIVEEYPSVNLMAQGGNRGKLQFSSAVLIPPKGVTVASAGVNKSGGSVAKGAGGVAKAGGGVAKAGGGVVKSGTLTPPTAQTGSSTPVPSPERRSNRQNVAIQAIIQKQAQDTKDKPKGKADPGSPQYLLGVPTSEPVFFRPGSARVPQTSTNTTQSQASPVPSKPTGQTGGVLVLKNQDHLNSQPTKSVTIQQPKIQTRQQARQPVSSWQPQAKQQQQQHQQQQQQQQQQLQQQQQHQQQHQQQAHHDKGGWSTAQVSSQNQPQGHVLSWQQQPGSRPQLSPQPGQGQWQFTAQNNYGRGEFRPRSPMPAQTNVRHPGAPVQQPTNSGMFHKAQNNFPQPSGVNQDQQFSDSTLKGPLPQGQPSSALYMPVSDQAGVTTSSMVHNSAHGDRFTGMDMNLHGSGERPSHAPRPGQPPMYRVPPPHNRFPPPPGTHFPTQLPDHMPASQGGNRPVGPTHGSGMGRGGAPFPGGPQNFSHAPGTERNHSGQAMQNQQQMSMAFQQGQFPLPFQGFMGFQGLSNNNQMKSPLESLFGKSRFPGDDIPPNMADIIGTLSKMAVQPPREHIMPQQRIRPSTFQGHAEGTPKPESFYSSQRSSSVPTVNIDVETKVKEISPPSTVHQPQPQQQQQQQQQLQQHQQQQQQQPGTYSLFSGSPWLSSGDTKSIGSSPFSSQSSSIRNSPDPNSDMFPGDSKGMDMGLRYGTSEERAMKQMMDQQAPFMPNNMQSIWSNQAQSPLERLLELQKQQRQAEPH